MLLGDREGIFEEIEAEIESEGLRMEDNMYEICLLRLLCQGDEAGALEYTKEYKNYFYLGDEKFDMNNWRIRFQVYYLMMERGAVSEAVYRGFIQDFPAHMGIEVEEVSPEGQRAGFLLNDLIVSIDGKFIGGNADARDLFEGSQEIEVFRDGEFLSLEKQEDCKLRGRFHILFEE